MRILPHQGQILILRAVKLPAVPSADHHLGAPPMSQDLITLAMFNIPDFGDNEMQSTFAQQTMSFRADDVEGIQITDPSDHESVPCPNPADGAEHPPITIFYRSEGGTRFHELMINPTPRHFLPKSMLSTPHYWLGNLVAGNHHVVTWEHEKERGLCRAFVLVGSQRSLVYVTRTEDIAERLSVRGFYSHFSVSDGTAAYTTAKHALFQNVMRGAVRSREGVMCKFNLSADLRADLRAGVKTVAWDEGTGRVFYVKPDDACLHVIDFAKAPVQGMSDALLIPVEDRFLICFLVSSTRRTTAAASSRRCTHARLVTFFYHCSLDTVYLATHLSLSRAPYFHVASLVALSPPSHTHTSVDQSLVSFKLSDSDM